MHYVYCFSYTFYLYDDHSNKYRSESYTYTRQLFYYDSLVINKLGQYRI